MNRKALLALAVVGLLLTTAASLTIRSSQSVRPATRSTAQSTPAIPFELTNRHIVLNVKVNNSRPLSFLLDTGDQYAIIDLDRAKELGLTLQGAVRMGGAGSALSTGAFVRDASFTIHGFAGFSQPVTMALPIFNLSQGLGRDFDGIIGGEFIKEFVLELDYQARLIKLHDKDKFDYTGRGESIPIRLNHGHPIIEAEVTPIGCDPIKGKFVLDIGSGGALALYSPFVTERNLLGGTLKTIKAFGAGAGGEITGRIGRVSELKIGTFRIKNPVTLFSQDKAGAFASSALAGNIGAQVASKFKIFLDYSRERIILEPNATFAEPFDRASGGVRLQAEGKDYRTFRIKNVLENSPASEAGLQQDDIVSAIDGRLASGLTLSDLNEMFERPVTYKLIVRRGDQVLKVTFTPRKLV